MSPPRIEGREYGPHAAHDGATVPGVKTLGVLVGVLLVISGTIFFFQGIDVLQGSSMTGDTKWAVIGPIVALVGAAMVVVGLRKGAPSA